MILLATIDIFLSLKNIIFRMGLIQENVFHRRFTHIESLIAVIYGASIQEWTNKICGGQPLKNLKGYGLLKHIALTHTFF